MKWKFLEEQIKIQMDIKIKLVFIFCANDS